MFVRRSSSPRPGIGLIGAGNFATGVLLPILQAERGLRRVGVATASGISARSAAERYGFAYCTSRYEDLLEDSEVDAVVVATRHNLHARIVADALAAGKAVFVEKPLALSIAELGRVVQAWRERPGLVFVGFNRRYAAACLAAQQHFRDRSGPLSMSCRVNAGPLPETSWLLDPREGGGRILGEVCHFVDTLQFFAGAPAESVYAEPLGHGARPAGRDTVHAVLRYPGGSLGSIQYATDGDPALPKERMELLADGAAAVIEECRTVTLFRNGKKRRLGKALSDKGHAAEIAAFRRVLTAPISGGGPPTATDAETEALFRSSISTTLTTLAILESVRSGARTPIRYEELEDVGFPSTPA